MRTLKNSGTRKAFQALLCIFIFSWIGLLSSCTATIRTPRHVRTGVVIESRIRGDHDNRMERHERRERRARHERND